VAIPVGMTTVKV